MPKTNSRSCSWCGKPALYESRLFLDNGTVEEHKAACVKHQLQLTEWVGKWNREHNMSTHVIVD